MREDKGPIIEECPQCGSSNVPSWQPRLGEPSNLCYVCVHFFPGGKYEDNRMDKNLAAATNIILKAIKELAKP